MKYELKTSTENVGSLSLTMETLKDLNETIDTIFSSIESASKENRLDPQDIRLLEDLCPYFGVIWPSARALAEHLAALGTSLKGARILELGCGLALPSLVAARLGATVVATDFHPEVRGFLERNIQLNGLSQIRYENLRWLDATAETLPEEPFDWVVASDVLYEPSHPTALAQAMVRFAGKKGRVILGDPGRPYLQPFVDEMHRLGFRHDLLTKTVADKPEPKDIFLLIFSRRFGT